MEKFQKRQNCAEECLSEICFSALCESFHDIIGNCIRLQMEEGKVIMKLTEERKAEVLALCKKLISNRSYSGEEDAVAGALKYFMRQKKFDDFFTDIRY